MIRMAAMKLVSIEPTPNPNSMKLNLDESLPQGTAVTYRPEGKAHYPEAIQRLLEIPGVQSLYHAGDFLAVQRVPSASWEALLTLARVVLSGGSVFLGEFQAKQEEEPWGEVRIAIQHFRRIPMLVKVFNHEAELKVALPERFGIAVQLASSSSPNMLLERRWLPQSPRFGELKEVGEAVAAELDAAYDQARLEVLIQQAFQSGIDSPEIREKPLPEDFESPDWKRRFAALEAVGDDPEDFSRLVKAMKDPQISIRRLATIRVGLHGTPVALGPLCEALSDPSVVVRRSAGDALCDLADPAAIPAMVETLKDPNKLVRWRAARFLYEIGGTSELPALTESQDDPEFEVRMQIRQAIERIEGGGTAQGPVWMRMTQRTGPQQ